MVVLCRGLDKKIETIFLFFFKNHQSQNITGTVAALVEIQNNVI